MHLFLAACSLLHYSPVEADSGDSGGLLCEAEVASLHPLDGAWDIYDRTTVEASLTAPDPDASISLEGPDGPVEGASQVQPGDTLVVFTSDISMSAAEDYTATLTLCTGSVSWSFETAHLY